MRARPWQLLVLLSLGLVAVGCGGPGGAGPDAGTDEAGVPSGGDGGADAGTDAGTPDAGVLADPLQGAWREGFGLPGATGHGAQVRALVRGPDGRVYAGGQFEEMGGVPARSVAAWDGSRWEALGEGLPGFVTSLAFAADGSLYAGGLLTDDVSPNRLARWDGTRWTLLPAAIQGLVLALAPQGTGLLVGGTFTTIDGQPLGGLARLEGGAFAPVGAAGTDGQVGAIEVRDVQQLCIGGNFGQVAGVAARNVACWDGAAWTQLGDGLPGGVSVLRRAPDGTYHAGGTFTWLLDYENTGLLRAGLAVLKSGRWSALAGGVDGGFINQVRALAFAPDGSLFVGGQFSVVGPGTPSLTSARNLARLGATGWSEVGGGLRNDVGFFSPDIDGAHALLVEEDGSLLVGGIFSAAGSTVAANAARFDGTTFRPLTPQGSRAEGLSGLANAVEVTREGHVVLGGYLHSAGNLPVKHVVSLLPDGTWGALGPGLEGVVYALLERADGTLVAGGALLGSKTPMGFVAQFDGTGWTALTPLLDGSVRALAEDARGRLYIGGDFVHAGALKVDYVVRWDGTSLVPLLEEGAHGLNGAVVALAVDGEGGVVAGGFFSAAGFVSARKLARWDGATWSNLGIGLEANGSVHKLVTTQDGQVLVAGTFDTIGGKAIRCVARWDGETFHAVVPPLARRDGLRPMVSALAPYGRGLFVGGTFELAGDVPAQYLAWFDGERFHALGGGLDDLPEALEVSGHTLYVAGTFVRAGDIPSSGVAIWEFGPR